MRYVITERQYRLISEQAGPTLTSSNQASVFQNTTNVKSGTYNSTLGPGQPLDPHMLLTMVQLGVFFIPFVGPIAAAGISAAAGLTDAVIYYNEGDKKTAGLVGIFAVLPGIGGLLSKLGLGQWSAKALGEIGKKIGTGAKLTAQEVQVVNKISQNKNLIQQEIAKLGAKVGVKAGVNAAKQNVKKKLVRKAVVGKTKEVLGKTAKFAGTKVAPYVGVAAAYDKGYDLVTGNKAAPSLEDLNKVDKQNISQTNLQASKELDF
jgi:hypothetical protein